MTKPKHNFPLDPSGKPWQSGSFPDLAWLSGFFDGNPKVKKEIRDKPELLYAILGRYQKEFGLFSSVWSIKEFLGYIAGYLQLPYDKVKHMIEGGE